MPAWIQRDWCSSFVLAMGHFLWQGVLIALMLAIALRATKTVSVRYWVSLAALLVMAACPIVTLGWLLQPVSHVATLDPPPIVREEPALSQQMIPVTPIEEASDVGQVSSLPVIPLVSPVDFNQTTTLSPQPPADDRSWWQRFAPQLTTTYLCGVALMLLRLVSGLWGGRRLRRRVHLIDDPSLLAAMRRQATALGLKLLPVLAYCERVTVPTVVGVLKPMILLPLTLTSGLSPEQMESVLAHELAHLRRRDHLVNLLQRVIESLLFFHPAVWWVSHRVREEREHCCDDLVVACGAMPLDYAKSLLFVAELSQASRLRRPVSAVSLLATGDRPSNLRQRIARLLGESMTPSLRLSPRVLLASIGVPLFALVVTIHGGASDEQSDLKAKVESLTDEKPKADVDPAAQHPIDPMLRPVSLTAESLPLRMVLEKMASAAGLSMVFDAEAIKQIDFDLTKPVSVKFENLPLGQALGRVINWQAYWGLMQEVRGNRLVLTTLDAWQKRIAEHLPAWMKPLYSHGLSARLDDNNDVMSVTTSSIATDDLLAQLATLPQLKELHIEVTKGVTPAGLAHLGKFPRLEKLSLYSVNSEGAGLGDDAIRSVVGLESLRELSVSECGTTDAGAKLLERLPQLTSLRLGDGRLTDEALKSIGTLRQLKTLELVSYGESVQNGRMRFTADGIRRLSELKNLEALGLVGHEVPADGLPFPKLTSLSLGNPGVGDDVAKRVGQLRELKSVILSYCGITDAGLSHIVALPKLRRLDLNSFALTDAGIEPLRSHPQLEHVSLRVEGLTDRSLEHIAQIKTLTRVDLHGNGQTGVSAGRNFSMTGLQQLKRLPNLATLWLSNVELGGSYADLKELSQLHELTMTMCDIRESELDALEEALPDTRISHMTGGGGWQSKKNRLGNKTTQAATAPEWGAVVNGLRSRVVPVLSAMSEDAIDPAQSVAKFEKPDDVAFAVEIENVTDKPIKLLDTRYGDSYGQSKGKANSNWYGQFLFSIDLFDADGQKIERPDVQVVDLNSVFDGALVASLEPGQTHRFLLRPAKWLSALTQRIAPGRYRAAVTYHGLPERVATRIKEYRPTSAVLAAVSGEIVSPQVPFELLPTSPSAQAKDADDDAPTRMWGDPSNGLRAAIELLPQKDFHAHGDKLEAKLHVQNYSKKDITLSSHLWLSELGATVKNEQGEAVPVGSAFYSGWTLSSRVTLKPKQIVTFDAGNIGLALTKERADKFEHVTNRTLVAPAGKYTMQLAGRFGNSFLLKDGQGKVLAPLEGDWIGELKTGELPLTIKNETIECRIINADTGKPVAGTTVNFRFIKPKSGNTAEEIVEDVFWGPQAPSSLYFFIPDKVLGRADRDEIEVQWSVGGHADYEPHGPKERIPLKPFFQEGTKDIREVLSTIKLTPKGHQDAATAPPAGLEFLTPYPKLHGLSLDMTEPQFLEIVKQQELKTRKTVEGAKVTHHIALGDGHTLIVMFDKDGKCSGIQRVRRENDEAVHEESIPVLIAADPLVKYGDQLIVSWVHHGDHRTSSNDGFRVAVLKDGTVIAAGDGNRNRECQIKLTPAQLEQLLQELEQQDQCFELAADSQYFIKPGERYNGWDRTADWYHVRRGKQEMHVGCIYGWESGTTDRIPGAVICSKLMARLNRLISVTRAGGWDEIKRLLPAANAALMQSFPHLAPLTVTDFSSSERFLYPARSIYFRNTDSGDDGFGVGLERRDDGEFLPITVWNGKDRRDVEKPPVVRGLDLAKVPFTTEWKEFEKLRVKTDIGI